MLTLTLESTPMLNTAGLLRWAMNGYKFKKDRKTLRRVFTQSFTHRSAIEKMPDITNALLEKLGVLNLDVEGEDAIETAEWYNVLPIAQLPVV